jgi:alginate O-acetyltransferase complex protein AlgI
MAFNSLEFAAFFVGLAGLISIVRADGPRRWVLIVGSYVFYGGWDVRFVPLLMAYTLAGWFFGSAIYTASHQRGRLFLLSTGVALALGGLAFFKYTNFLLSVAANLVGLPAPTTLPIILPVGISFFTFEVVSYLVDIYRGVTRPARSFRDFALFMAFFPRLVAGPIIRPAQFLPQIEQPLRFDGQDILAGSRLFIGGLVLKTVCADNLAVYVDAVYRDVAAFSGGTLLFATVSYSAQIFADFCGYSLMAIGLARAFGIQLPQNFDYPYIARSIAEFWHRWHISLSTWLRDYLYIPLGGSRHGQASTHANLMITMTLGGLWHGASWNFVIWGICHGLALVFYQVWRRRKFGLSSHPSLPASAASWLITFTLVTALWIPFRSPDIETTLIVLERILTGADGIVWLHTQSVLVVLGMALWHGLKVAFPAGRLPAVRVPHWQLVTEARNVAIPLGGLFVVAMFGQPESSPFIYFQF